MPQARKSRDPRNRPIFKGGVKTGERPRASGGPGCVSSGNNLSPRDNTSRTGQVAGAPSASVSRTRSSMAAIVKGFASPPSRAAMPASS